MHSLVSRLSPLFGMERSLGTRLGHTTGVQQLNGLCAYLSIWTDLLFTECQCSHLFENLVLCPPQTLLPLFPPTLLCLTLTMLMLHQHHKCMHPPSAHTEDARAPWSECLVVAQQPSCTTLHTLLHNTSLRNTVDV